MSAVAPKTKYIDVTIHLLATHRPRRDDADLRVNQTRCYAFVNSASTLRQLKQTLTDMYQVPIEEQHFYHRKLTLSEARSSAELVDTVTLDSLDVAEFSLIIQPVTGPISTILTPAGLQQRLPHINAKARSVLLTKLQNIPPELLSLESICERPVQPFQPIHSIIINNYTTKTIVKQIIVDGEELYPYHITASNTIEFRNLFTFEYSAASESFVKDTIAALAKLDADIAQCKKMLRELPIALKASQDKFAALKKAAKDKSVSVDLNELGALVVEQEHIPDEIEAQQKRLASLKPPSLENPKLYNFECHTQLELPFGWHKFGSTVYQLIAIPTPTEQEINAILARQQSGEPALVTAAGQPVV